MATTKDPPVLYVCQQCGQFFQAPPRSRIRFCQPCVQEKYREGGKRPRPKKEHGDAQPE